MRRLLLLLVMIAFGVTNSVAAPLSYCLHADRIEHAAARASEDAATAAVAHREDAATAAAEKKGSAADSTGTSLSLGVLPESPDLPRRSDAGAPSWDSEAQSLFSGRAVAPLLHPPLN